jgi:hypothetical protein
MISDLNIKGINFRCKKNGWKKSSIIINTSTKMVFFSEPNYNNAFFKGFLQNIYLRPSCYKCPSKFFKSGSDITIGDYWGIQNVLPDFDDDKGVSLVMINTEKGKNLYDKLEKDERKTRYDEVLPGNPNIEKSVALPSKRAIFFRAWRKRQLIQLINRLTRSPLLVQVKSRCLYIIVYILKKMGLYYLIKSILKGNYRGIKRKY